MQVSFDQAYGEQTEQIQLDQQARDRKLAELQRQIVNLKATNAGDFETFTALYRKIFLYVKVAVGGVDNQTNHLADRFVC